MAGIPDIPESFFKLMGFLAFVGFLALAGAIVWGLIWLIRHIRFV